jgi:hypothetical protein
MSVRIHSLCVRPEHRGSRDSMRLVTVHAGEWAFCPSGADGDHDWQTIEPVGLETLARMVRARAEPKPASPEAA